MRKVPLLAFPCYRFKPEKITASGVQRATILGTKLWPHEVCPASRKTHYSLLKTEVFGSKSPWESIMQPGSNPCFSHPSPACRVKLSSQLKYNIEHQSHLLYFFLTKVVFTVPYYNHCRCSREPEVLPKTCTVKYSPGMLLLFIALLGLKNPEWVNSTICSAFCWDTGPTIIWVH